MHFTPEQILLLSAGAFFIGLSKTGIAGLGVLSVALFSIAMPAKTSTGALLPLLICADLIGVALFRKHASWSHLWKLFPWVVPGVVIGCSAVARFDNLQMQRMIGWILLVMVTLHVWRRRREGSGNSVLPHTTFFAALAGIIAGFTTMVANAAGPVMILYLLAIGLPKMSFVGTSAWFFMLVNMFKVPFSAGLGLITWDSLVLDAALLIPMLPGAFLGPRILKRINQKVFELIALVLTGLAALRLVWW